MQKEQIDWLVMHQANMRIMSAAADRLGVPPGAPHLGRLGGSAPAALAAGAAEFLPGGARPQLACNTRNPSSRGLATTAARQIRIRPPACICTCLPAERVVTNLSQYGNTSAASIPLALDEAVRRGDIQPGEVS